MNYEPTSELETPPNPCKSSLRRVSEQFPTPDLGLFPLTVTVTTRGNRNHNSPLIRPLLRTVTGRGDDPNQIEQDTNASTNQLLKNEEDFVLNRPDFINSNPNNMFSSGRILSRYEVRGTAMKRLGITQNNLSAVLNSQCRGRGSLSWPVMNPNPKPLYMSPVSVSCACSFPLDYPFRGLCSYVFLHTRVTGPRGSMSFSFVFSDWFSTVEAVVSLRPLQILHSLCLPLYQDPPSTL